ncbi:AraC family transcriptional regulator [Pinibacter aurantiacus]|uniref:AraC family transcriptional regulator n=1 Tax=Pinibacter aurantiacus TaxID=2851599 RepID=A0A9E2W3U6_9BACT|nr:AraC family transcriptional regulator [Pinibacter aurantiacus]MBV4358950.1 AraC family transcriptional regulator [Pinibacter aurantiacus]
MTTRPSIQYSCYFTRSRTGEQFVPEHAIGYIVSGAFEVNDGTASKIFNKGELYFCRRNQLAKYAKYPEEGGEFRSVSIFFEQEMLRDFSIEFGYKSDKAIATPAFQQLQSSSVLAHYMESLKPYEDVFKNKGTNELLSVKQKEALLLLLQIQPALKNVLFDFSEPGKIDLEGFMNRNFHFNVDLKRFAYLTGRSLSTFKRDFEKIFHITPSRWLLQRRLQEAYYLLKEKRQAASDIYLDLGFEDLSHFSFAFKKQYGVAPSML